MSFGTVFEMTADGKERVLHKFTLAPDGALPKAGVTVLSNLDGTHGSTLFGTTEHGGNDIGTVYELRISDEKLRVLYNFEGRPNGVFPDSSLLFYDGAFYGTAGGGSVNKGIVYKVDLDGTERVVYDFKGVPDAHRPVVGLVVLNDRMYGTTRTGGVYNNGCVYEVRPNGKERVLYSFFGGIHDGRFPEAELTVFNGALYGTTSGGGLSDDGTVFEVSKDGTERKLHDFRGRNGSQPRARLTVMNGKLYGTTEFGGTPVSATGLTAGTVFEVQLSGTTRVLHEFDGGDGGRFPRAGLTEYKGALYGTTSSGGTHGFGAVFEITP